jgi:hypothetical protein
MSPRPQNIDMEFASPDFDRVYAIQLLVLLWAAAALE